MTECAGTHKGSRLRNLAGNHCAYASDGHFVWNAGEPHWRGEGSSSELSPIWDIVASFVAQMSGHPVVRRGRRNQESRATTFTR